MTGSFPDSGLLPAEGIQRLLARKKFIQQEAQGRIPESLVEVTTRVVARLAHEERLRRVLKPGVFDLVQETLKELRQG
jgi:hypothetical protein